MPLDERLVGVWVSDLTDDATRLEYGEATLEISGTGELGYIVDGQRVISLVARTEGALLITVEPESARVIRTRFLFDERDRLLLTLEGKTSVFVRG